MKKRPRSERIRNHSNFASLTFSKFINKFVHFIKQNAKNSNNKKKEATKIARQEERML